MKSSNQDTYYYNSEGDDFFERNYMNRELPELRTNKKVILENISKAQIQFDRVLEFGCCYGDLLSHLQNKLGKNVHGVEASAKAVEFAKNRYSSSFPIEHGTIGDNRLVAQAEFQEHFDLILVDDVFGWVSRETVLQSMTNIDALLKEGGYLYIRDFFPDKRTKNRNHHVSNQDIFNYKVPGSHAGIFVATGMYEPIWQEIYYDGIGMSTTYKSDNPFNYRWTDLILQKSKMGYFNESKKVP